jgi:hypothetical protein
MSEGVAHTGVARASERDGGWWWQRYPSGATEHLRWDDDRVRQGAVDDDRIGRKRASRPRVKVDLGDLACDRHVHVGCVSARGPKSIPNFL